MKVNLAGLLRAIRYPFPTAWVRASRPPTTDWLTSTAMYAYPSKSAYRFNQTDQLLQGKVDIAEISDEGAVTLWLNKGSADTSVIGDGVRLASLSGSGLDDYVWLSVSSSLSYFILRAWLWAHQPDALPTHGMRHAFEYQTGVVALSRGVSVLCWSNFDPRYTDSGICCRTMPL